MLVTQEKATVTGDLAFSERVGMQFDPSAMGMQVRNAIRMYANPRQAALREYTSNAKDANKAAGATTPVLVTLPSALHPFLTIQDQGVGLDREELKGYGQFGHTTKDKSNDYIGGFGLGSKSGLAVAQQFTVIAVKNGKKNVVVVGWDETGLPSLGFLDEQDTTEGNGVTIQIPSAQEHGEWANITSGNMFIGWERGSILINGKEPLKSVHDTDQFTRIDGGWLTKGERERYYYGRGNVTALVHGVHYSIPSDKFANSSVAHVLDGSVLDIPNGSVDILPSRDDLEWTDRTRKAVREVSEKMVAAVVAEYEKQIKKAKTFIEAKKIADSMKEIGLPTDHITFKGVSIYWDKCTIEITRGVVKSSASAKSGYQNDRTATKIRNLTDVHTEQSILVTELTGETKSGYYRKDMVFVNESSDTVPFIISVANTLGVSPEKIRVYYTHQTQSELPEGFVLSMTKVYTPGEFAKIVADQRKEFAKNRAATRTQAPKQVDRQLRVVTSFSNWSSAFSISERSEQGIIAGGNDVVVIHAEDALGLRLITAHVDGGQRQDKELMKYLATRTRATDTVVVILAKNHKAANLAITGWKSVSDWFRKELSTMKVMTPLEVAVDNYRRERPHYNVIPKLPSTEVARINDKEMREWMEVYTQVTNTRDEAKSDIARLFPEYAPVNPEASTFRPWEKYTLIPRLSIGNNEEDQAEFVNYLNLVHRVSK